MNAVEESSDTGVTRRDPSDIVDEHRVFLFFPFEITDTRRRSPSRSAFERFVATTLEARVGSLIEPSAVPSWVRDKLTGSQSRLWTRSISKVSTDVHPFVRRLTGGASDDDQVHHGQAVSFDLVDEAVAALTGRVGTRGDGLQVALSADAAQRAGFAGRGESRVSVMIHGVQLLVWQSRLGLLVFELEYRGPRNVPINSTTVLYLNHLLCRTKAAKPGLYSWCHRRSATVTDREPGPSLECIAELLAQPARGATSHIRLLWKERRRLFAYSFVGFDVEGNDEARQLFAYRLSHRYTRDYEVVATDSDELYWRFKDVIHSTSLESGCVVVSARGRLPFLRDFLRNAVEVVYLPLTIVAFHEYQYLLRTTQDATAVQHDGNRSGAQVRSLRMLVEDLANFRLYFRFSQASQLTQHNDAHRLMRRAFQLDRLLEEAEGDARQAHSLLVKRRWRICGAVAIFATATFALTQYADLILAPHVSLAHVIARSIAPMLAAVAALVFYQRAPMGSP